MQSMKPHVLDSSALMAYLERRPGADTVESLLTRFRSAQQRLFMSVVNWGETYYSIWRRYGQAQAEEAVNNIERLPLTIMQADIQTTKTAASFKVRFALPYADCFAAALAYIHKARLVTSDPHFERVKAEVRLVRLT